MGYASGSPLVVDALLLAPPLLVVVPPELVVTSLEPAAEPAEPPDEPPLPAVFAPSVSRSVWPQASSSIVIAAAHPRRGCSHLPVFVPTPQSSRRLGEPAQAELFDAH
jgi:hypothetical protein